MSALPMQQQYITNMHQLQACVVSTRLVAMVLRCVHACACVAASSLGPIWCGIHMALGLQVLVELLALTAAGTAHMCCTF